MRVEERGLGEATVRFLASVRGLVREEKDVNDAVESFAPDCIVLPVGPREHEEIIQVLKEKGRMPGLEGNRPAGLGPTGVPDRKIPFDPEAEASDYDDFGLFVSGSDLVFMRRLSRWGEVEMPPPSFQEAVRLGYDRGIEVRAVDFDDDEYTDVFLQNISALTLVRQGRRLKRLTKRRFKAEDPVSFAYEWDAIATSLKGYRAVEQARELRVLAGVREAAKAHKRVLAVIEVERLPGVLRAIDSVPPQAIPPSQKAMTQGPR